MSLTVVEKRLELEARNGKTDELIQSYGFSRSYTGQRGFLGGSAGKNNPPAMQES